MIDDLTVKNRLLRRKLRQYESLHCSHLQQEKLFEVRVHGLPPEKKGDLERALRKIAASVEEPPRTEYFDKPNLPNSSASKNACKSLDPYPTPVDSAYASTNTSELVSNPVSCPGKSTADKGMSATDGKLDELASYTEAMPQTLVPLQHSSDLTEKLKKQMVVQRLEQMFTGKSAPCRQSEFSHQQQDVSNSATAIENGASQVRGNMNAPEGAREARILPQGFEIALESASEGRSNNNEEGNFSSNSTGTSNEGTPDQRPTRPMDLDVHRMQVGAEHMEYIRHLGLASPVRHSNNSNSEEGWVYLNLLGSMAQLHTFNVTPEFVRKAIKDCSSKLELSPDGQQIRWSGVEDSPAEKSDNAVGCANRDPGNASAKAETLNSVGVSTNESVPASTKDSSHSSTGTNYNDLVYKPLFHHEIQSDDDFDLHGSDVDFATESRNAADVSNGSCALQPHRTGRSSKSRSDSGPIVFYKGAFCTDLSGNTCPTSSEASYCRYTQLPLGAVDEPAHSEPDPDHELLQCSSLKKTPSDTSLGTSEAALYFPDMESLSIEASDGDDEPMIFEASGLGGIQPEDNFVVHVNVHHPRPGKHSPRLSPFSNPRGNIRKIHHKMPSGSTAAFHARQSIPSKDMSSKCQDKILWTKTTKLPPSTLPPASYLCEPLSSSEGDAIVSDESEEFASIDISNGKQAKSDCHAGRQDDSDEILPHTGHLSSSVVLGGKHRSSQGESNSEDDSEDSVNMLASGRSCDP